MFVPLFSDFLPSHLLFFLFSSLPPRHYREIFFSVILYRQKYHWLAPFLFVLLLGASGSLCTASRLRAKSSVRLCELCIASRPLFTIISLFFPSFFFLLVDPRNVLFNIVPSDEFLILFLFIDIFLYPCLVMQRRQVTTGRRIEITHADISSQKKKKCTLFVRPQNQCNKPFTSPFSQFPPSSLVVKLFFFCCSSNTNSFQPVTQVSHTNTFFLRFLKFETSHNFGFVYTSLCLRLPPNIFLI